jgi:hypothetical protein
MNDGIPKRRGGNARNNRTTFPAKQKRQAEAKVRQEARAKRSPQDQLKVLDQLFGKGAGAAKERAKLLAMIKTEVVAQVAKKLEPLNVAAIKTESPKSKYNDRKQARNRA